MNKIELDLLVTKEKELKERLEKESPVEKIWDYPYYFKWKWVKLEILKLKTSWELKTNLKWS